MQLLASQDVQAKQWSCNATVDIAREARASNVKEVHEETKLAWTNATAVHANPMQHASTYVNDGP